MGYSGYGTPVRRAQGVKQARMKKFLILSSCHQLGGRVGPSRAPSVCFSEHNEHVQSISHSAWACIKSTRCAACGQMYAADVFMGRSCHLIQGSWYGQSANVICRQDAGNPLC